MPTTTETDPADGCAPVPWLSDVVDPNTIPRASAGRARDNHAVPRRSHAPRPRKPVPGPPGSRRSPFTIAPPRSCRDVIRRHHHCDPVRIRYAARVLHRRTMQGTGTLRRGPVTTLRRLLERETRRSPGRSARLGFKQFENAASTIAVGSACPEQPLRRSGTRCSPSDRRS
jgi:hypothetical protein